MPTSATERRDAVRIKVFEVSIITSNGNEYRAHLLDVSDTGARAHCTHAFEVGQQIAVRWDRADRPALVCWTQADGKLGLRYVGT
ncbi:PilZ domain-containing protein [Roseomonas aeriglobus]|nr:PilZ domain-containing protein [Roseomonas aeriglobus]